MKMIKMALLGGAALAVTAGVARADDLADLKAQVEALNARVATMEAAPAVPAGYSLLSISEGDMGATPGLTSEEARSWSGNAQKISILPTADAPAGAMVEWNGFVRAILGYSDTNQGGGSTLDVVGRGRLNVRATTDTAVGEVGVSMRLEGNGSAVDTDYAVELEIAWGWWAMTPELTLAGGYNGSLGNIGFGYDGACNCHWTDNADVGMNPGDATQMRLSYASGPMSFAIALEDATGGNNFSIAGVGADGDELGVAGELAYAGDTFSGEISGVFRNTDINAAAGTAGSDNSYQIGAGLGFSLDPVSLSMGGAMGQVNTGDQYWVVSGLASVNLTDEVHAEVAAGYKNYDGGFVDQLGVLAGIYYAPVDQLTIGLEGEYQKRYQGAPDSVYLGLVTVYSFAQ